MWGSSRAIISGIVLLGLTVVLAACGGGEDTVVPTDTPPSEVSFFEGLLGGIPDTPDTRKSVMINDYAAVRELLGLSPAGPDAEFPALIQYAIDHIVRTDQEPDPDAIRTYTAEAPFITGMSRDFYNPRREFLAFDGRNVDQSVEAGVVPSILEVALGRFDPAATAQALEACSECPPPDIVTHNGVSFYSWGEDHQGNLRGRNGPPAFDHLGRGGRIAVSSDYVYRTVETPGMKALIDAKAGDGPTLADVEEFRLLGRAISGLAPYTAFFSDLTHEISATLDYSSIIGTMPDIQERLIAEIGNSSLLLPYLAYSTGAGYGEGGPYMALALVHSDSESAEENDKRLARRVAENEDLQVWMEGIREYTSNVEGRVLSVKIRGERPASAWRALAFTITPLIPHE